MGMIDDALKALDRIPIWKRLGEVPGEVDGLKRRVADLEAKYGGKWPPDVCKYCGERAARLQDTWPEKGKVYQTWICKECGQVETKVG